MRKHFTKKRVIVLAVAALAIGIGTGAYAFFNSSGHGTGAVAVGHSGAFTVTVNLATGGPMLPGGGESTYMEVTYTVANQTAAALQLNKVTISIADADGNPWSVQTDLGKPACTAADFELAVGAAGAFAAPPIDDMTVARNPLAAGDMVGSRVRVRMIETHVNQDNCQDATVPLYLAAS